MKSSPEQFPRGRESQHSEAPKKYEGAYAPDVAEGIQQLKDMIANREFLLAELLQSRNNGNEDATKKIADDLETAERLIREFSGKLAENIDIERHELWHLHKWLDAKDTKQH